MKSRNCDTIQGLIIELDDTRLLYARLMPLLIQPHLKFLVLRLMDVHVAVADALASHVVGAGESAPRRGGGLLAGFRARIERWRILGNMNLEGRCLKRMVGREASVMHLLRRTLLPAEELQRRLYSELLKLERTVFQLESMLREMALATPLGAPPPRQLSGIRGARG